MHPSLNPNSPESKFLLAISSLGAKAGCSQEAFTTMGNAALGFPGVCGLTIGVSENRRENLIPQRIFGDPEPEAHAVSGVRLAANGQDWGEIRIYFEPRGLAGQISLLLTFLAQQLAMALNRIELEARAEMLRKAIAAGQDHIRSRKSLSRAAVVLARDRKISETAARSLIQEQSHRMGKTMSQVAEAILLANSKRLTRMASWEGIGLRRTA